MERLCLLAQGDGYLKSGAVEQGLKLLERWGVCCQTEWIQLSVRAGY